ncbi:MAG TPA: hypothetical protein VE987_21160 [Polyangiaceae bacterium]|nr:hypothetical protein [Polyangiaceae bacterium]
MNTTKARLAGHGGVRDLLDAPPFRETRLEPALRVPAQLATATAAAMALGPIVALASRRAPAPSRALRAVFWSSGAAYFVALALDLREHLRLEKRATGHYLRFTAVPLLESATHAAILATALSAIALARPMGRRMGLRDAWTACAPAVLFALGLVDEIVYHRGRAPAREELIHAVEHVAEGIMWTALYGDRLAGTRRRRGRVLGVLAAVSRVWTG